MCFSVDFGEVLGMTRYTKIQYFLSLNTVVDQQWGELSLASKWFAKFTGLLLTLLVVNM